MRNTNRIYVTVLGLEGDVDEIPDLLLVSYQTLASKNRAIAALRSAASVCKSEVLRALLV